MEKLPGSKGCFEGGNGSRSLTMTKEALIEKIKKMLHRDAELVFLSKLDSKELRILLAGLRDLIDREMLRV